jgi:hypothetical protein
MPANPKDLPNFSATFEIGHVNLADKPLERCQAFILGEPCPGKLERFGKGSRKTVSA